MKVNFLSNNIGIIGGSGVYQLFSKLNPRKGKINTPFGTVTYSETFINQKKIFFLSRHGQTHTIPPHKINFKANIFALFKLGVKEIIATNAVGSLKQEFQPGDFVIIDQFIDLVSSATTFFDGDFEVIIGSKKKGGVVHTDMTYPYSEKIRSALIKAFDSFPKEKLHPNGTYVMFKGPRFESSAEISMFKNFGDVVGMTGVPEVILSRELEMDYASLNVVTNFAAGLQREISNREVMELFNKKVDIVQKILKRSIDFL